MDTDDIAQVLRTARQTRHVFVGVFAANRLPRGTLERPAVLIVNSQADCFPGSHWTCFYLPEYEVGVEHFDSLGAAPTLSYFTRFISRNGGLSRYSNRAVQSSVSDVCGEYCCVFALERTVGISFRHFTSQFSLQKRLNDRLVLDKFNSYFTCNVHFMRPTLRAYHVQTCAPLCHGTTLRCIASRGNGHPHARRGQQRRFGRMGTLLGRQAGQGRHFADADRLTPSYKPARRGRKHQSLHQYTLSTDYPPPQRRTTGEFSHYLIAMPLQGSNENC